MVLELIFLIILVILKKFNINISISFFGWINMFWIKKN